MESPDEREKARKRGRAGMIEIKAARDREADRDGGREREKQVDIHTERERCREGDKVRQREGRRGGGVYNVWASASSFPDALCTYPASLVYTHPDEEISCY